MTTLTGWLTILNLLILIAGSVGGTLAFRSARAKAETDIQERIRDALSAENELLQSRITRLEKENKRLNRLIQLIILTLKKTHNIELGVDEDMVVIRDSKGTHTVRIDEDVSA